MAGVNYKQGNSSQIQQKATIFIGAGSCLVTGTATVPRNAKGEYLVSVGASETVYIAADLGVALRDFTSAVVNYLLNGSPNGALSINSVSACYAVTGAALTSCTVGLSETDWPASGVANGPTVKDILAPTAVPLAVSADFYQSKVTPANPALLPLSTSQLLVELAVTTAAGGAFLFGGFIVDFMYNI